MSVVETGRRPWRSRSGVGPDLVRIGAAALIGLLFGYLTFQAQSSLPSWIDSISNSASGWSLVAVVAVWILTDDWRRGAVIAPVVMVLLNVGYAAAAELAGLSYFLGIWTAVGVLAGPFIGAAAALLSRRTRAGRLAHALLGGLLVAEALVAYATVLATTSWVYWTLVLAVGLALVARGVVRAPQRRERVVVGVGAVVVVGLALVAGIGLDRLFYLV